MKVYHTLQHTPLVRKKKNKQASKQTNKQNSITFPRKKHRHQGCDPKRARVSQSVNPLRHHSTLFGLERFDKLAREAHKNKHRRMKFGNDTLHADRVLPNKKKTFLFLLLGFTKLFITIIFSYYNCVHK